jgi:hypothetical protein
LSKHPRRLAILILTSLLVGGSVFYGTTWRPDCDAWRVKANARLAQIDALGPGGEVAGEQVLHDLEPQRPLGCSL